MEQMYTPPRSEKGMNKHSSVSTAIMQSLTFIIFMVSEKIATFKLFATSGLSASQPVGLRN